jgi:glucokinase
MSGERDTPTGTSVESRGCVIGIDIGGTKILAVALDSSGAACAETQVPTPDRPDALLDALHRVIDALVDRAGPATAIGLGLPGFLSLDGIARQAPNLPAAVGLDVPGDLRGRYGVPVAVNNDANCAAWAARHHDAPEAGFLVAVTFGTGIGGGIVLDGRLVRGANGFAGEPGHMVVDVGGDPCVCGQRGCWERYASGNALGALGRRAAGSGAAPSVLAAAGGDLSAIDGSLVGRLALAGDVAAGAVLDDYAGWVAVGLVNLVNLLDPGVIILGGGVVALGDALMARVDRALERYPTVLVGRHVIIKISDLGPTAGAVGAGLLATEIGA